ncbi:MAG: phosphoenolpyruvate--protein phosphotransferase [Gammaproteobacteria bacterium]|nr:phosphoenolpyruvate--protein phosphotransferase [Gammaproteobacteria bacterium]MDH5777542.1 phosphoenolpyruvate--protein phosphotransferase [Gammaproteobacteria bacterium]
MLDILRRIIQEVNSARNLDQALNIIVQQVKQAMAVDVCSVYLSNDVQQQHVLMASEGLREEAIGKIRLAFDEGLVSLVASRAEPVNLANAPEHPRYYYFPETGEEEFSSFLGVPIIHHRKVLGVLVVQTRNAECYLEDSVTFLITIASQLAGAIAHAAASGEIDRILAKKGSGTVDDSKPLRGLPGAPGVGKGTAVVVYPMADLLAVPDRKIDDIEAEIEIFNKAVEKVRNDITDLASRLEKRLPAEDKALFDAYLMMLDGASLPGETIGYIRRGYWAPAALRETIMEHVKVFREMNDPYLSERADDVFDLGRRILAHMQSENIKVQEYPQDTILVGDEITATMLAEVPTEFLKGVVSVRGSRTSHVAILSRALGIPAVMGATDLPVGRVDGCPIIADGYSGNVIVSPSKSVLKEYDRIIAEEAELTAELMELRDQPAHTSDGVHIPLYANTGLLSDISPSLQSGAEGIGLYRTEFPFMIRQRFPGEDEQYQIYRQVLEAFAPRPVYLRTLDVGGDKALPYFPINEENPFLGWRGIRITLDHPEIFLVQARAMMRASVGLNNLHILLPMISSVAELTDSILLLRQAHAELVEEGIDVVEPKIGVMIEVPSAVYLIDSLARRVDFFSIGTNDLTQYLLAVDRNNANVAELYDSLHPAVIRAIFHVVLGAKAHNIPVSVCGEMAGDPAAALLLIGMGVNSLSMSASSLTRVKWVIRNVSKKRALELLDEVMEMEDPQTIRQYLNSRFEVAGMGGLVRAGK